jgi:hypothetical protein
MKKPRTPFNIENKPKLRRFLKDVNRVCYEVRGRKTEVAKLLNKRVEDMPVYLGTKNRPPKRELRGEDVLTLQGWLKKNRGK